MKKNARFMIGDSIQLVHKLQNNSIIRKGTVTKGPILVDGIYHYHVKWDYDISGNQWITGRHDDLISDMSSTKYEYQKS